MTRIALTVRRAAAGRTGRVLSGRSARLSGRILAIAVILLWSLFPLYWALNTSLTTLSAADSTPAHYFPSPLVPANFTAPTTSKASPATPTRPRAASAHRTEASQPFRDRRLPAVASGRAGPQAGPRRPWRPRRRGSPEPTWPA